MHRGACHKSKRIVKGAQGPTGQRDLEENGTPDKGDTGPRGEQDQSGQTVLEGADGAKRCSLTRTNEDLEEQTVPRTNIINQNVGNL